MPLPKTTSMGKMMSFLKKDKPGMPQKQKVAIALNQTGKGNLSSLAKKSKRYYA